MSNKQPESASSSREVVIPQPKTYGPLGNLPLIDMEKPTLTLCKLAEEHGPIYRLTAPGYKGLVLSGHELVAEVCDESRFDKYIYGELENVRAFGGDGLFTARTHEPNWKKAHNILLPTFGQQAMKGYHPMMLDIAQQLIDKWARLNPLDEVDVPDDMTRLTLDTIGLCGFNYRFNSYYRETHNPFIVSMVRALNEAMHRSGRLRIQNLLMVGTRRRFDADVKVMFDLVDQIITERKEAGDHGEIDLLARMLHAVDPDTGERLDDENIRYQIITFLIAGHETTSGLLSFALYFLIKHPEVLAKAYEEVDRILDADQPTYKQVLQLSYIRMILNESLRLWPTAPGFDVYAREDTVIGGRYPLSKGDSVSILLPQLHRDRDAWGADAEQFRPERFADPSAIPHHAFKPFGNGQRACIGMQFALHEATLVLGMILQHFELIDHTNYTLDVKQTLTIKPGDFTMRVKRRPRPQAAGSSRKADIDNGQAASNQAYGAGTAQAAMAVEAQGEPLLVLYGSNLGTAEGIARQLSDQARASGMQSEARPLDEAVGKLPTTGAVVIVTASYNGQPPANSRRFVEWLKQARSSELTGVHYSVFGCGDRSWATTYQAVPRQIDQLLVDKGATRLGEPGEADAGGDFERQFEDWHTRMVPVLRQACGLPSEEDQSQSSPALLKLRFTSGLESIPQAYAHGAADSIVVSNRELHQAGSARSTRHIELILPAGMTYQVGDHLGVLPVNRQHQIERVLRRYEMNGREQLLLHASGQRLAHLPLNQPIDVYTLLGHYVELQEPASRAQLRALCAHTVCPPHRRELEALLEEDKYADQVAEKRLTMLDLLEKYPACELPLDTFISLLPPLKPRYYSISSSPDFVPTEGEVDGTEAVDKSDISTRKVSVTVGVVRGDAWSGYGEYQGVASNYLATARPGDAIAVFTRTPESGFTLPADNSVPIIMVGPGTGVAPFRGFLQAREILHRQGATLGSARLFFGCRDESAFLYREELEQYAARGQVELHVAYSRPADRSGFYVQNLLSEQAMSVISDLSAGGHLYICGDGRQMAPQVEHAIRGAYAQVKQVEAEVAAIWWETLVAEGRYAKDVWNAASPH